MIKTIPRILISADRSSSGKTTLSMGIMAVLKDMGYTVQPFKVALDYIDPEYHSDITGRKCRNLDGYLMSEEQILDIFNHACLETNPETDSTDPKTNLKTENEEHENKDKNTSQGIHGIADIAVIEGVRGLFEGLEATSDIGSTAQISKILKCPVILVINARSMTRSCAALVSGFKNFDEDVEIAGVILNNIGSKKHAEKAIEAIETYTKIPVVGVVRRNPELSFSMRELGLVPVAEGRHRTSDFEQKMEYIKKSVLEGGDIQKIIEIGNSAQPLDIPKKSMFSQKSKGKVRIGIAKDDLFNFYYENNIDLLKSKGAEIVYFSPLYDEKVPDVDAVYIGGGNIEFFAEELEKNVSMRKSIKSNSDLGMPIFGESGGFNYLTEKLIYKDPNGKINEYDMVSALPGKTYIGGLKRIVTYTNAIFTKDTIIGKKGEEFKAHEFHYTEIKDIPDDYDFAVNVTRGFGIKDSKDGLIRNNTIGTLIHFHGAGFINWAENLVNSALKYKEKNKGS
ncbi:MAG: hydrogenobyrinic acid a,c-diamide synthase (glutamine-hydrolyzing) [Methanosarcinaceae archaeon]|nr:hydrogenobyrinic acid a,c-diamide synthase (glutamine-hydrolyzing) [Methanosarcinaceae archaeon]